MTATHIPTSEVDWADERRVGVSAAARRYWIIVLLPMVLLAGAAVAIALKRTPVYTAETRLIVGRLNVSSPDALPGFEQATESLAAGYSRAVVADAVVGPAGRALGISPQAVRARTSATPIQNSPAFKVEATGGDEASTVRVANATTTALVNYVSSVNRSNPDSARLLKAFTNASLRYQNLLDRQIRTQARARRLGTSAAQADANRAVAVAEAALLDRDTFRQAYLSSQQGQSTASLVQILAPAVTATSDRSSVLGLLLVIALALGLVIGLALATLRANRRSSTRAG